MPLLCKLPLELCVEWSFSFSIYFSPISGTSVSRAVGCLMKDSVCSNHSDICCCFEASHCLLCVSVHSRWSPQATRAGLSCQRRALDLQGRNCSGGWNLLCGNRWRPEGSVDGGWDKGVRSVDHHGLSRWCYCWRKDKATITGWDWWLLMGCEFLIKYSVLLGPQNRGLITKPYVCQDVKSLQYMNQYNTKYHKKNIFEIFRDLFFNLIYLQLTPQFSCLRHFHIWGWDRCLNYPGVSNHGEMMPGWSVWVEMS